MRLLIADLVRRSRWKAGFFSVALIVMVGAAAALGDLTRGFAASMGTAFALGPQTLWYVPRPIWYLPIAKRDIWRAGWLISTIGVTLLTTAVKLVALIVPGVRDSFGLPSSALSSVYDFAYAGIGCGFVMLATRPQPASGPWRPVSAILKGLADIALPLGLSVWMLASFGFGNFLPTHWSDVTARSGAALVAALAVAAATYFHSPLPQAPANRLVRPRMKRGAPRLEPGGLSGLPRLLVHESLWTLMVGGSLVIGSVLVVVVAAQYLQSSESLAGLLRAVLLRLDAGATTTYGEGLEALILFVGFAVFAASLTARFPDMLRHLRVLPVGAARLEILLLVWPAAFWVAAWIGLLLLHYIVIGHGAVASHADVMLGLIGVSAIVQALTLRLSAVLRGFALACSAGLVPLLPLLAAPTSGRFAALGVGALTVAAVLNHRSLARTSTYRPIGPVIGLVAPPR